MGKIAFLVPHAPLVPIIEKMIAPYEQVFVEYCGNYDEILGFAAGLVEQGCEIIIARAGTASRIRRSGLDVAVVELPVTGFDIIRALTAAQQYGPKIAVVAYAKMVRGIECLTRLRDFSFRQYTTEHDDAAVESLILQALRDGADVVVGGGIFCQIAEKHGLPAVFIDNGEDAIRLAIDEAFRLESAIESEKIKRSLAGAILDHVHDGIITVDVQQNVTSINRQAQQILKLSASQTLGRKLESIWPGLKVSAIVQNKQEETNVLISIKERKFLCNMVPILANHTLNGVLITFQAITTIQQAEANIRKAVYNKGHQARKIFDDILGESETIKKAVALAREYAATRSNILILGETGTGKEVFAQSIHNHSERSTGPFVAVNCAALPAQLLESELFGYVGGAFTGANKEGKPGLFELAHGGTIFLDEIAEMDYANQSRLLRVVQERSVMRLGSDRIIAVDVRVIAATNKDLKGLVLERQFREDLFYRLNVLKLELPPLRERRKDISCLLDCFLSTIAAPGRTMKVEGAAMRLLENYNWPGNIRELQNVAERIVASCQNGMVSTADAAAVVEKWDGPTVKPSFRDEEIWEITDALNQARGVQRVAAKILGMDRSTLWRKMRRLGISI